MRVARVVLLLGLIPIAMSLHGCSEAACGADGTGCIQGDVGHSRIMQDFAACEGKALLDACAGGTTSTGVCASNYGNLVCVALCDGVPAGTCELGYCHFVGVKLEVAYFGCAPDPGTLAHGAPCAYTDDCVTSAACIAIGDQPKLCHAICTDTCGTAVCTDTGLGFGVCVAEQQVSVPILDIGERR